MNIRPSACALSPLMLFLVLFFGAGLYYTAQGVPMAFYQLRAPVAILPAVVLGLWFARRRGLQAQDTLLKGIANPCALLLGAAQMLDHLAMPQQAERLRKAIIATLEAKDTLTPDLGGEGNTLSFAKAIATRL